MVMGLLWICQVRAFTNERLTTANSLLLPRNPINRPRRTLQAAIADTYQETNNDARTDERLDFLLPYNNVTENDIAPPVEMLHIGDSKNSVVDLTITRLFILLWFERIFSRYGYRSVIIFITQSWLVNVFYYVALYVGFTQGKCLFLSLIEAFGLQNNRTLTFATCRLHSVR